MATNDKLTIEIEYCAVWNYLPRAVGTAAEILQQMSDRVESLRLIPSGGGRFEVTANGEVAHSKAATGRFPEPAEIQEKLRQLT
jgi:selT/selW/selH-like putative selenoprotein